MNYFLLPLLILYLSCNLSAQITLDDRIFPQAGETLQISSTTVIPSTVNITASSSSAQTWDFSELETEQVQENTIRDASMGANTSSFPSAVIIEDLMAGFGTAYVNIESTKMQRIGAGIEFVGISFVEHYDNPHTLQKVPMTYSSSFDDNFELSFEEHIDSVPFLRALIDSMAGSLPIQPDSIRLNVSGRKQAEVDAFGSLSIYDGSYTVLRQRVEEYNYFGIEVYVPSPLPFFPGSWFDVTSLIAGAIPFDIPLADTSIYYDFLAEDVPQPIARLYVEDTGSVITSAEFKGINGNVSTFMLSSKELLKAYPNPASSYLEIEYPSWTIPNTQATIWNSQGQAIHKLSITNSKVQIPLTDWVDGIYFFQISNDVESITNKFIVKK